MAILETEKRWRRTSASARRADRAELTQAEEAHVRAALRFLWTRCGGAVPLSLALDLPRRAVSNYMHGKVPRRIGVGLALRAARLAGVPLEELLAGAWPPAGACPHCGRLV